jgi:hypothetical protein
MTEWETINITEEKWESTPESPNDDRYNFKAEINVYERVGLPGAAAALFGSIISGGDFSDLQRKINQIVQDPVERFAVYVDAISRNLSGYRGVEIVNNDIIEMLTRIKDIKDVQYKNPSGYVLGFLATNGGRNMDKENIKRIIEDILPHVSGSVEPADVIRYSRLWMGF